MRSILKSILFIFALSCNIFLSCSNGAQDDKEPYSNYDTAKPVDNKNSPDPDSASNGTQPNNNAQNNN